MNILGISCFYHDAAAALIKGSTLAASMQEERFTRVKNTEAFPREAIRQCLRQADLHIDDIDHVVFYEKPLLKLERVLATHLRMWPRSWRAFLEFLPEWARTKLHIPMLIRSELGYKGPIRFVDHHLSHAASTFLVSPYEQAAILTFDGVGEWATATRGVGQGQTIDLWEEIRFPHSLGLLFSAVTGYLGFRVLSGEGNMMGLKAYGRPRFVEPLRRVIDVRPDGSFRLDLSYFRFHYGSTSGLMVNHRFERLLGHPARDPNGEILQHHADIAASLQEIVEDAMVRMARHLHEKTGLENLCLAGGVALNALANSRILRETPFENVYVPPAAGDAGAALGAAAYMHTAVLGQPRLVVDSAYLGTSYEDTDIKAFLDQEGVTYRTMTSDEELIEEVAESLSRDEVVGWFRGRMELGPRSLGSRSILASPLNLEMKDILNAKVKRREGFRPFGPVVPTERVSEFFETDHPSPFMLFVAPVRKPVRERIPTVTHVDGSARIQTVDRSQNPALYDLLIAFEKRSGVPILVNTSFNTKGAPIVESPREAYECFRQTRMDHLVLGSYLISQKRKADEEPESSSTF